MATRKTKTTKTTARGTSDVGLKHGFRSGLEEEIAESLEGRGVPALYEAHTIQYTKPARVSKYTPDFILPNGIVIESKGRFVTADRQKHLLIADQYPDLDLRFVFSRSKTRISKQSKTTYAMWCDKNGFLFTDRTIPDEWLQEPFTEARAEALRNAGINLDA